jgi:hypothetical protein
MPSSYDNELGIELQAAGENLNTWGQPKLNNALRRLTKGVAGFLVKPLTADATLTSSNTSTDPNDFEARHAALKFTGDGAFTVTVPSSAKLYVVWNACAGALTLTTGVGEVAEMAAGEICEILCDGTNVKKVKVTDFGGSRITGVGAPEASGDATPKSYVDGLAFAATDLPGQGVGTNGRFVRSNGSAASWETITVSDVTGAAPLASPRFIGDATVAGEADIGGGLDVTGVASVGAGLIVSGGGIDQVGGSKTGVTAVASTVIDFSANDCQTKAISANTAFTVMGLEAGKFQVVVLILTITSSAIPSFPAAFDFQDGLDFLASLGNGKHWLTIASHDGGTSGVIGLLYRNVS